MKATISILSKTIVRSFYKEYALFFLIGLYVCFGLLKTADHVFLAKYIVASPALILFYFAIWSIYNLFIISYFQHIFSEERYLFLYDLWLINKWQLTISLFVLHLNLMAPVLMYAVFVLAIAANLGFYWQILYIAVFLALSIWYPLFFYFKTISKPDISLSKKSIFSLNFNINKRYFSFFFYHLLENDWLKLLVTKGLSAGVLVVLISILQTDNDDIRPLLIVVLMGFLPNFSLIASYHAFENQALVFFKNLPISTRRKWLNAVAVFAILLLPELFLLYRYAWLGLGWASPIFAYILGLALATLYYSGLYLKVAVEERFTNIIFIVSIACFVAILFKINVLAIILVVFCLAYFSFTKLYYQYEFVVKSEN
ncbi:MAG: hypothetical protein ACKVOU_08415 [Cytophagales bacterium]